MWIAKIILSIDTGKTGVYSPICTETYRTRWYIVVQFFQSIEGSIAETRYVNAKGLDMKCDIVHRQRKCSLFMCTKTIEALTTNQ